MRPYAGSGNNKKKKIKYSSKVLENLPNQPLTNHDILKYATILKIPYFRGVFMRDTLPKYVNENESAVINLDSMRGTGTHWVCYRKRGTFVEYYDSFGNLPPPLELQRYFNSAPYPIVIKYNYFPQQKNWNTVNCGHLCLNYLSVKK